MASRNADPEDDGAQRPSRYRWRYGPLRLVMPWVSVFVGALMAIMHRTPLLLVVGIGLVLFGVVAFFVYRFMARRGL